MALPKLKAWQWVLVGSGVLVVAAAGVITNTRLMQNLVKGDVGRDVRAQYTEQKSGVKAKMLMVKAPDGTPAPTPTALVKATPSPSPSSPMPETAALDLTGSGESTSPGSSATPGGAKLEDLGPKPQSNPSFTINTQRNDSALVVQPNVTAAPPVPDSLLNSRYPGGGGQNGGNLSPSLRSQVIPRRYLFDNEAPDALGGNPVAISGGDQKDYSINSFAPEGEIIQVIALQAIASSDMELDVQGGVIEPFIFQGHTLLEIGDRLIGKTSVNTKRDRILINWTKVKFFDGRTCPINAIAQNTDGTIGVPGYPVGSRILQAMTPVLLETASAFIEVFKDRSLAALIPSSINGASINLTTANPESTSSQLTDAGISAMQGGLNKISEMLAQDLESNKPYILVVPGTRCQAYLRDAMDTSTRDYGK